MVYKSERIVFSINGAGLFGRPHQENLRLRPHLWLFRKLNLKWTVEVIWKLKLWNPKENVGESLPDLGVSLSCLARTQIVWTVGQNTIWTLSELIASTLQKILLKRGWGKPHTKRKYLLYMYLTRDLSPEYTKYSYNSILRKQKQIKIYKGRYSGSQKIHEMMLHITSHQGNAN